MLDGEQLTSALYLFWGPVFEIFDLKIKFAFFVRFLRKHMLLGWESF